jgi:hypothetical protein
LGIFAVFIPGFFHFQRPENQAQNPPPKPTKKGLSRPGKAFFNQVENTD